VALISYSLSNLTLTKPGVGRGVGEEMVKRVTQGVNHGILFCVCVWKTTILSVETVEINDLFFSSASPSLFDRPESGYLYFLRTISLMSGDWSKGIISNRSLTLFSLYIPDFNVTTVFIFNVITRCRNNKVRLKKNVIK
jgi:hypothetical protein